MSRYFFDTEFLEDGQIIDLVSIGVICEDGREFYRESADFDESKANDWCKANMLPKLGPKEQRVSKEQIKNDLLEFIGDDVPTWIAYYASYDFVALCQLFGTMMDKPKGWPKFCWDLKQEIYKLGNPKLPKQDDKGGHNSLADAKWLKDAYIWLRTNHGVTIPLTEVEKKEAPKAKTFETTMKFFADIKSVALKGENLKVEAIGDNTVDNLLNDLKRATGVEIGQFSAALLNQAIGDFVYAYSTPHYEGFKAALGRIIERYRLMDGAEQGDLFEKINLMFKDLFVSHYSDLGPEAAELIATRYSKQMVDFIKSQAIQAADLSVSAHNKIY